MSSLAIELFSRAVGFVAAAYTEAGLWVIAARGRSMGSLANTEAGWRLTWFEGADPRLINYTGVVDGDVEALAQALTLRLGAPVRLNPLSS